VELRQEILGVDGGLQFCFESPSPFLFAWRPLLEYNAQQMGGGG
jgi:hypothetical protein